ncbi:4-hydroxythreonine-4-phosphate dehydrogenase PdxA [Hydrogenobaculum acidophilum]
MKKFGITMGDPAGIGPELVIKLKPYMQDDNAYIIYGEEYILKHASNVLGTEFCYEKVESIDDVKDKGVYLISLGLKGALEPSPSSGKLAIAYLARATADAISKKINGLLTMPISKYFAKASGFNFNGQTEYLAFADNKKDFAMMMYGDAIKVVLATIHIPLKDVANTISIGLLREKIKLIKYYIPKYFKFEPNIKVLGLNPHAGEGGVIGDEESKIIIPAIKGENVLGPIPPDTAFIDIKENDIFLCMYHDQGLIPFKMLSFDNGSNVTIGLSFLRTSPDHGTAYDIAYKGLARPDSAKYSLELLKKYGY